METLTHLFYGVMAAVALRRWVASRGRAEALAAGLFGVLFGVSALGELLPTEVGEGAVLLLQRLNVCVLVAFPWLLFLLGAHFEPGRRTRWAGVITALVVAATMAVPSEPDGKSTLLTLYSVVFFGQWTVLSIVTASRMARAGRDQPAIARRRMRMMAAGAALIIVCLLAGLVGFGTRGPVELLIQQIASLVSVTILWFGISPPPLVRMLWRRREERAVHEAELGLLAATTPAEVIGRLLPPAARLVGATGARVVDGEGQELGRTGSFDAEVGSTIAIPLSTGRIEMAVSCFVPYFGDEELSLLHALAAVVDLALDRCASLAVQREAGHRLADSEARLAQAQQIAGIGSFAWSPKGSEVTWSEEMHRLLGYEPGTVVDYGKAFADRIHADDLKAVLAAWQEARVAGRSDPMDYRLVLPGGILRWVQGRSEMVVGSDGVARVLGTLQDITDRKAAEEHVAHLALHDSLTGLPNRSRFTDRLENALRRRSADGVNVGVLFLDIDRFKWVNDSLGHAAGDALLVEVARRLLASARVGDTVARFGGDEFAVLCDPVLSEAEAEAVAGRFAEALARPLTIGQAEIIPTVSIGIAVSRAGTPNDAETLLADADAAMYRAKELGRNRCERYDHELRSRAAARFGMESALRRSIDAGELSVHYQPEIDLGTGEVIGFEALVRWEHPDRGMVSPAEFIPLAEETGLIVPLGRQVLERACAFTAHLQRLHGRRFHVAVNLSGRQLLSTQVASDVSRALQEAGLDASSLRLEITETVLLDEGELVAQALRALKALGVQLAVDDFGTGYSSLTYLKRFPVDVLKIDRSFVEGLGQDCEDDAIVAGVIDLAHAFGLITVGEGVERLDQQNHLRTLGCEYGQGYFWSSALDPVAVERWLGRQGSSVAVPPPPATGRRILLVEDDMRLRLLLRTVFGPGSGYDVVAEAADGRQAISLARRLRPDVILLDMAMPGMGGLQALPLLRASAPDSTIAVLSGIDDFEIQERAVRLGADVWLTKGDDPTLLPERLTGLVHA